MLKRLDESQRLIKLTARLSNYFAQNQGILIIIGIGLIIIGFVLELINHFAQSQIVGVFDIIFRNVGIIVALIGIAIVRPLGD